MIVQHLKHYFLVNVRITDKCCARKVLNIIIYYYIKVIIKIVFIKYFYIIHNRNLSNK